jgi:hypothetical protein
VFSCDRKFLKVRVIIRIGFSIAIAYHWVLNAIGGMDGRRKLDLERKGGGAARIRRWFGP